MVVPRLSALYSAPSLDFLLIFFVGCGGGGSSNPAPQSASTVAVVLSAPAPSVAAGASVGFFASVTGSTNTKVTWQVNGTTGGNSTVGTISTSGLYVAPGTIPN